MRNMVADYKLMLSRGLGSCICVISLLPFRVYLIMWNLSYFLTLTPAVNDFAASCVGQYINLVVGIHFKRVGFELYIYIYI